MTDEQEQQQPEPKKYFIDTDWFEKVGRSFRTIAEKRYCAACKDKVGTSTEERVPTIEPKTGRVVYEVRTVPYGSNPISVIRGCCARERGYITLELPVLEAIFRVFLANGNQPSNLEAVREELSQWFPLTAKSHGYAVETLERLIRGDQYYGLREFNPPPVD